MERSFIEICKEEATKKFFSALQWRHRDLITSLIDIVTTKDTLLNSIHLK